MRIKERSVASVSSVIQCAGETMLASAGEKPIDHTAR